MSDAQALAILIERRGVMYDPAVVDVFLANYASVMPAYDPTPHPASRVIEDARLQDRAPQADPAPPVSVEPAAADGLLAVSSLSRALTGEANVADAGALLWAVLKQVLPCDAMALLAPDSATDRVTTRFAAGVGAPALRGIRRATASGVVGWVAATRRAAVNADPLIDLRDGDRESPPALASCLAVPLLEAGALVAVLALYRTEPHAFSDDHVRLVELLGARVSMPLAQALAADTAASPLVLVRGASRT
jgi:GAF domain-containing protein